MRIQFTPKARTQVLKALEYIRRDRPIAARRYLERAEKSLSRLKSFPNSGRTLPEFPDLPFREVIVAPYRFFHRVQHDTVWIAAVWHGAQIPGKPT